MQACNRLKRKLKRNYVQQCVDKYSQYSSKLWRCIREFWPDDKNQKTNFSNFGGNIPNVGKAEKLNSHFTSVTKNLSDNLPLVNLENLNLEYNPPVFDLHEISLQDIADAIAKLSNSPSCGDDGITSYMIKCAHTELLQPHITFLT